MPEQQDNYKKGRGAQINLKNRFIQNYLDKEDNDAIDDYEEPVPKTTVYLENPKSIISTNTSPDLGWDHSINPYQGCEHGCTYCYARNSHEYWGFSAGLDFETKIIVKKNAAELLEKKLLGKSWTPKAIMLSGNTDCYQPMERKFEITRSLLKVFDKYQNPVGIITKNSLIKRDIDILEGLAQNRLVHVAISITTLDEKLRSKLEPRTASAVNKLKTIEALSKAGVPVMVMVAPVIPGLNHHEIPQIISKAADSGAIRAAYSTVRLNGVISDIFKDWLDKNYPMRSEKVWNQIAMLHDGKVNDSDWGRRMKGEGVLSDSIAGLFKTSVKRYMPDLNWPEYDFSRFRRGGNYSLF